MKLIKLKCSNCGANLEVNGELKNIFCNYCGQNYVLDDETVKIEHILDTNKSDIDNAVTYLNDFKDYDKAYEFFLELSKKNAGNSLIWEGLLRSYTYDFSRNFTHVDFDTANDYYKKFLVLEKNKNKKDNIKKIYDLYLKKRDNYLKEVEKDKQYDRNVCSIAIIIVSLIICLATISSNNQERRNLENVTPSLNYVLESDKTTINVKEKLQIFATDFNRDVDNYDIRWFIREESSSVGGTVSEDGVFSSNNVGEYYVCSEINNVSRCQIITVQKPCPDSYTFKLDGASSESIRVQDKGEICPGKYKIKVSYLDDHYYSSVSINYTMLSLYDDWEKIALASGDVLEIDRGITKVQLKKTK